MIYVAQIAADNSCITFDKKSSMYARYGKNAVKVETLPDGAGTLRCDGEAVWRDEIPETLSPEQEELVDPMTTLEMLAIDHEFRLTMMELGF